MITFGIQKKIDSLGRIVLPKEIREFYCMDENDTVEVVPTENGILIRKHGYKVKKTDEENKMKIGK
ncbi:MAG: AbrB/MazE/SpoVT family DNA-binding domain-containing protein [Ruminococcaceae bacterium]|nr:AbrB/MazE/SpoVT family DNA-binding domain-containing protein [Oscillospiraceae bacterium]